MIYEMYSMKDELSGYMYPIPFMKEEIAKRYLKEQVENNITLKTSPEDFSLWKIGTFDSETGIFENLKEHELIERGKNYAKV